MSANSEEPRLLDLSDYSDRDRALGLAAHGCPRGYTAVARENMQRADGALTTGLMLFGSFVSRMRGLHEGVVRELERDNPHAVFPLLRAWLEVITIGLYTIRRPTYANYLAYGRGEGRPGQKSFEAMFAAVRDDASQLKPVYQQLSDYSHFGQLGVWNAHSVGDENSVTWTDVPRWKSDREFQIACSLTNELAVAGQSVLDGLGTLLITASPRPHEVVGDGLLQGPASDLLASETRSDREKRPVEEAE